MPSFGEQRAIVERWQRFPSRERLDEHRVALTFDDGPDPEGTPAVLEALDAIGARATFFMVGEQAEAHPRLGQEVAERGHGIGLHGLRHVRPDELDDPAGELRHALAVLERTTGVAPTTFRPPYGHFTEPLYEAAAELGLEPVLWSAWGLDWEPIPAERIADLVLTDLEPGAIVVLHDSARYAPRASVEPTAEALGQIGARAARAGIELQPL
ncbi:MAG: polysaccharide deacetylase family protein [Actinomycetota bacterium]|nr:polysaccharide deacetylase family protein [Actinomycetota bacterium]MDQ3647552.1 polysaccharide deacetylase family protein [Actinomycetota bacterium]